MPEVRNSDHRYEKRPTNPVNMTRAAIAAMLLALAACGSRTDLTVAPKDAPPHEPRDPFECPCGYTDPVPTAEPGGIVDGYKGDGGNDTGYFETGGAGGKGGSDGIGGQGGEGGNL